tara:strand:+ start:17142 stop:18062 length:921 start_codon:yes stop_codon:yes gene_type:complete
VIERIYIPTVRRANNQITYDNLPDELKKRVIMVIESKERYLYNYPCKYLEIPEKLVGTWTQLAETRKFIHKHAGAIKYCVADDDILLGRRNAKYWTGKSNMEKSRRRAKPEEILEAFDTMDKWLDEPDIGIAGFSQSGFPPANTEYVDTKCITEIIMIDGRMLSKEIDDMDITSIRVAEDILFLFECLSRGINTRQSTEWMHDNQSLSNYKEMKDTREIWTGMYDDKKIPDTIKDYHKWYNTSDAAKVGYEYIKKKFPHGLKLQKNKDGDMKYRHCWSKVYRPKVKSPLEEFAANGRPLIKDWGIM